jgi:uncharacterized Fe-S cluster protein YjdI
MDIQDKMFSNDDITVTYEACICTHAEKCARELSEVFRDSVIPWINLDGTETTRIIKQIKRCPSGALKYFVNEKKQAS